MKKEKMAVKNAIPFLRWAGGKKWLAKDVLQIIDGLQFNNYHEPFLGGGAIFFAIDPKKVSYLNDYNEDLISTYCSIKSDVEGVIKELNEFENTEQFYYSVRDKKYRSSLKRSARFIFLNQTSFNGIYRVNREGKYNVPYGYRKKDFLDPDNLRMVSKRLQKVRFTNTDFSDCIGKINKNDLVFLDPPYTITHNNNGFFKYNQKLFSESDQYRLSEMIDQIKARGAFYILTNAAHDRVKQIFSKGDRLIEFKRASLIGGVNAQRGKYEEIVITNIPKPI